MKIAYDRAVPGLIPFSRFMHTIKEAACDCNPLQYSEVCDCQYVVAAYDQEELVGLGRVVKANDGEPAVAVSVCSAYKVREIEQTIVKLLKIEAALH